MIYIWLWEKRSKFWVSKGKNKEHFLHAWVLGKKEKKNLGFWITVSISNIPWRICMVVVNFLSWSFFWQLLTQYIEICESVMGWCGYCFFSDPFHRRKTSLKFDSDEERWTEFDIIIHVFLFCFFFFFFTGFIFELCIKTKLLCNTPDMIYLYV